MNPPDRREPTLARLLTAGLRLLPRFVIIGAQRCGTTSLYNNLVKHPCVAPAFRKEVHFFDHNFEKGNRWYRAHFPSLLQKCYAQWVRKRGLVSGEASPHYLFHPLAPERMARLLPQVKLIALLRNPIDRAYSHYRMKVKKGFETLSFEDALNAEARRLNAEVEPATRGGQTTDSNRRHFSYLLRGIYVDQLKVWRSFFDESRMLILRSETFLADPAGVMRKVVGFLELPRWEPRDHVNFHVTGYAEMDRVTRSRLIEFFRGHNQRLADYVGLDFEWDR